MSKFVVGLAFDEAYQVIVLLKKNRGLFADNIGKWNGPGGLVYDHESPFDAMERKFFEETGVFIRQAKWTLFCDAWKGVTNIQFSGFPTNLYGKPKLMKMKKYLLFFIDDLPENIVSDLVWMIPLATQLQIQLPIKTKEQK